MQVMSETEQKELAETGELRLIDPTTNTRYIAVDEDEYEKLKEKNELRSTYRAVLRAWDMEPDPNKGAYNDLRSK